MIHRVKLIRQIYDEEFAEYYESGHMKDYFSIMSSNFSEDYDYWLVFLAEDKGYATFLMCYKVGEAVKATRNQCPRSFLHPEVFNGRHKYFKLKETDIISKKDGLNGLSIEILGPVLVIQYLLSVQAPLMHI